MGGGGGGLFGGIFGGGGGGGTTYNVPQPAAPTPIDYDKVYAAATRSAIDTMREQEATLKRLYPTMTGLQLDTVNQLARGLDNEYLQRNRRVIDQELRSVFTPNEIESQIQGRALGDLRRGQTGIQSQLQADAQREAAMGQTAIESRLLSDAQNELALGRSLSAEEQRDAAQSARAAFAARGLGSSLGSAAAEMLNRDAFGRQRQDQRRQFAMGAEQYARQGTMDRRNFAMGIDQYMQAAETDRRNQALGANQLDIARRQRRLGLASAYADLDPYTRATGPAFQVGSANTGQGLQAIGQTFGNALNQSGNVASFNSNLQAGMYNSWQNNNAAIQAANITGRASQQAGQMAMMGGMMQGLGSYFSDKRMKKDIKPVGKGGGVLGLTAYEYRYKGEDKDAPKHVGFMAQDVQKVLPEAVEELTHKGKKRLAIKPQVIGQALAAELEAQQEAMFAEGYTVK